MKEIALLGHTHTCKGTKSSEHKNGPIISGQVKVNGKPVARKGDKTAIGGFIDKGDPLVKIE